MLLAFTLGSLHFCVPAQAAEQSQPPPGFYSEEKEAALGARLAMQVRRETTPLELPDVDAYVDKLAHELARHMSNALELWQFTLIKNYEDSSTYEPISMPGGWIFIPAQLILESKNEGAFAGMLAHAMAHVALRQGLHRQTPGDVTYLAGVPVVVLMGPGTFGQDGQSSLVPASYLNVQRGYELQADTTAAKVIAASNFNPNDLLNYIARMQPTRTRLSEAVSPMPSIATRISNLESTINTISPSGSWRSPGTFHLIQDEVRNEILRQQAATSPANHVDRIPSLVHPDRR